VSHSTSYISKLKSSKLILEKELPRYIEKLFFEPKLTRIRIKFRDGIILYIQFNDFDEYAYSIIFSKIDLDRCRFDNYDDKWSVSSRPHHFHPRNKKAGFSSPMTGIPNHDIPVICNLILSMKLFSPDFRFENLKA